MVGKVYLVGAGPGDPGLLTLRGKALLSQADVVVYDALVSPRILSFAPDKTLKIFRGSRGKAGALSQNQINSLLIKLARRGKKVVRLKGGDPYVFGRGAEEGLALQKAGVPFEVVPGVSSAIAVPAYAGIPVTHREYSSSFTVVTGHEEPGKNRPAIDWTQLSEIQGTLVFLMGLHALPEVVSKLISHGKDPQTPAAAIQWGTTSRQKIVRGSLATLFQLVEKAALKPPVTVVIGKVVDLVKKLDWISKEPLRGTRILVTRGRSQASYLSDMLLEKGAELLEIPTIEIYPLPIDQRVKGCLTNLGQYEWVVFSSVNAVELFMMALVSSRIAPASLKKIRIACVGEATAKSLEPFGLKASLVPKDYKQEGLVKAFKRLPLKGKRFFLARGKEGRDLFLKFLQKKGALVDSWALYENRVPPDTRRKLSNLFLKEGGVDLVTFASSSAADHFYCLFTSDQRANWLKDLPVGVIGPVTAATVRKWGGKIAVQPKKYTLPALVEACEQWARKRKTGNF